MYPACSSPFPGPHNNAILPYRNIQPVVPDHSSSPARHHRAGPSQNTNDFASLRQTRVQRNEAGEEPVRVFEVEREKDGDVLVLEVQDTRALREEGVSHHCCKR